MHTSRDISAEAMSALLLLFGAEKWSLDAREQRHVSQILVECKKQAGELTSIQAGDLIAICCNARISDVFAIMEACGKHRRPVYRMPKRGKMVYGSESLSLVSAAHGMLQLEKLGVFVHMDEVLSATKAFIHSSRGKEGLITDEEIDILWLDRTRKRRNEEHRVSCPSAEISERFDDAVWQSATGHTMNLRTEGDQLVLRAFSPKAAHDRRGAGQRHCGPSPHVHGETGIPVF